MLDHDAVERVSDTLLAISVEYLVCRDQAGAPLSLDARWADKQALHAVACHLQCFRPSPGLRGPREHPSLPISRIETRKMISSLCCPTIRLTELITGHEQTLAV